MTFWDKNKTLLKYKTVSDFTRGYLIRGTKCLIK